MFHNRTHHPQSPKSRSEFSLRQRQTCAQKAGCAGSFNIHCRGIFCDLKCLCLQSESLLHHKIMFWCFPFGRMLPMQSYSTAAKNFAVFRCSRASASGPNGRQRRALISFRFFASMRSRRTRTIAKTRRLTPSVSTSMMMRWIVVDGMLMVIVMSQSGDGTLNANKMPVCLQSLIDDTVSRTRSRIAAMLAVVEKSKLAL